MPLALPRIMSASLLDDEPGRADCAARARMAMRAPRYAGSQDAYRLGHVDEGPLAREESWPTPDGTSAA